MRLDSRLAFQLEREEFRDLSAGQKVELAADLRVLRNRDKGFDYLLHYQATQFIEALELMLAKDEPDPEMRGFVRGIYATMSAYSEIVEEAEALKTYAK